MNGIFYSVIKLVFHILRILIQQEAYLSRHETMSTKLYSNEGLFADNQID